MIKTLVSLSENQIKKIKTAYKNKQSVRIFLSYKKIEKSGDFELLLTESQKERFDTNRALGKGIILELSYDQLKRNHSGGFLPILFAALGTLGALAGGSAAIANAIKTSQHQSTEEAGAKRHNAEMEKIAQSKKTLSLGSGIKKDQILPLSNLDIERLVKDLKIKHFRGVFMKDELPKKLTR